MKIAIVQFDTRPFEAMGLMPFLLQRNKAYAARHGYAYHYLRSSDIDRPPVWQKPHLCRQVLESGYDAVAWMDTDAVFHDLDRRIEPLFEGDEIMVAASDNGNWASPFNAGVFFVRAPGGEDLMQRWSDLFATTPWVRKGDKWVCEEEWAGSAFEQGAFVDHLLEGLIQAGELRLVDWRVLQSPLPMPDSFTLHFAGRYRANLPGYMELIA